ncbi:NUDIX hydrolase [Pedobacter sp.]|nr:NUDIX hydrolase [Candidatus Saccharibacteria bacterium]
MNIYDPNYVHVPIHFLLGVKTIVVNEDNEVLLLKRSDKSTSPHRWDFPGGGVDRGENPLDAAIREIKEETGLDVSHTQVLTTYLSNKSADEDEAVIIGYTARCLGKEVKLSWEHEDFKWVTLDELKIIDLPELHTTILKAYIGQ